VLASARILANGAGAGGGGRDDGGHSTSNAGGVGAGGSILLEAEDLKIESGDCSHVSARGGDGNAIAGGTVKLFYGTFSGQKPMTECAGRVYDAGAGSAQ